MDGHLGYNLLVFISKERGRGKNSVPLSGCCWTDGQFCWQVMPFGLNNAIVTYQRAMNLIFHYFIVNIVEVVYIDDVVVKSFLRVICLISRQCLSAA